MTDKTWGSFIQWRAIALPFGQSKVAECLFALVVGAAICSISWREHAAPLLAALLPVVMVMCRSRVQAWFLALGYGLDIGLMGFGGAGTFFGGSWLLGLAAGCTYGLVFSATVAALYPNDTQSPKKKAVAILAWTVLWTYPPLGAFLAGSLVATWGFWFPGTKWLGLALGAGITTLLGAYAHTLYGRVAVGVALVAALVLSPLQEASHERSGDWVGVSTNWGVQTPETLPETLVKMRELIRDQAARGAKVVVFPESIIGTYDPSEDGVLEIMLKQAAEQNKVSVVFGANAMTDEGMANIAREYEYTPDGVHELQFQARQTVPIAEWNPLSRYHYPAHWFSSGVMPIGGRGALFLFCYEEFLPWEVLYSIGREKPDLIVAMSNLWWTKGTGEPVLQHRYTEGYAKLFGLPLVVATNR
ncbi:MULTISPECIES: conjugal transfer protein TraB [Ralstonia]|jgi:hypothetical protein|uniref:CN hydrolase domain-containing protein n=2 Tax=Ralstonia pickettii TaxID=329 RepID=R0CMX3_RALPI|nr:MULTISPECIES: conjugal transfer protein TraB [Ralstonia]ENZ77815.1 hypothetical protein OR214_02091 [Ralstonia pickettii OR214]MCM3582084.1 conjugal transfer protein TraB [Ralstonia pickettii]